MVGSFHPFVSFQCLLGDALFDSLERGGATRTDIVVFSVPRTSQQLGRHSVGYQGDEPIQWNGVKGQVGRHLGGSW